MSHISEPVLKPAIAAVADAVRSAAEELLAPWPWQIRPRPADGGRRSIYDCLPALFGEAFPTVDRDRVISLSLACRLHATALFTSDSLMDGDLQAHEMAGAAIAVTALQAEANHVLYRLFPPDARFWVECHRLLRAYATACLDEKAYRIDGPRWSEFTEATGLALISGKDGFAQISVAGMCELAGDYRLFDALCTTVAHYYVARQLFDDLVDWQTDIQRQSPSVLLARLLGGRPLPADVSSESQAMADLARELYYDEHARWCLSAALDALDRAGDAVAFLPSLSWHGAIDAARLHCTTLLADLERLSRENRERVALQDEQRLHLPAGGSPSLKLGVRALKGMLREWQTGFGEATHVLLLQRQAGTTTSLDYHAGTTFQRALIAQGLLLADAVVAGQVRGIVDALTDQVVRAACDDAVGGWRYFADLPECPPDVDTLGHVIELLHRQGRREDIEALCTRPLDAWARSHQGADDEPLSRWIVPAGTRSSQRIPPVDGMRSVWRDQTDAAALASLGCGLLRAYSSSRTGLISRLARAVSALQHADGSWRSAWYAGPYYATYRSVRFLGGAVPGSPCLSCALEFLLSAQGTDGGWGHAGGASDALSSSLALLALADLAMAFPGDRRIPRAADEGCAHLAVASRVPDRWPAGQLIQSSLPLGADQPATPLAYASRTMTTLFVMQAGFAWHLRQAVISA